MVVSTIPMPINIPPAIYFQFSGLTDTALSEIMYVPDNKRLPPFPMSEDDSFFINVSQALGGALSALNSSGLDSESEFRVLPLLVVEREQE